MNIDFQDYSLFFRFSEDYGPKGFFGIDRCDPLILQLEEMMVVNNQFFVIANLLLGKIILTSNRSQQMIGVNSEKLTPYHNIKAIYPGELYRNTNGWENYFKWQMVFS